MKELILAPMAVLMNLGMVSLFRVLGNNKGEADPNNPPPTDPPPSDPPQDPPPAPSAFDDLMSKKGFKSNDDFASSYSEAEASLGRAQNARNTTKQQLESAGYSIDDNGNISQAQVDPNQQQFPNQQTAQQPTQQPYGQPQQPYGQPQAEPIYDPYTGQVLTSQMDIQLAQMSPSQRIGTMFNLMTEQRESQSRESFTAEQEVLSTPEAKGFEEDVKRVMQQVPLAQRVKKESWSDALLKVKGMKYDEALKGAGRQGVDDFLNKDQLQQIPAGPGAGDGATKLSAQDEANYQYYAKTHPGMFKDRQHFARNLTPTGGR